jgi:hypothetical protein
MPDTVSLTGQVVGIIPGAGRITLLSVRTDTAIRQVLLLREIASQFSRIRRGARIRVDGVPFFGGGPLPIVRAHRMARL